MAPHAFNCTPCSFTREGSLRKCGEGGEWKRERQRCGGRREIVKRESEEKVDTRKRKEERGKVGV